MTRSTDTPGLADFPVVISLPIQWGDQDAFGHVNNTVPIRWFESCRIVYFEQIKLESRNPSGGLGPILANIRCNYRSQLSYPDTVHVGARITRLGRTSLTMEHVVFSETQEAIAADGDSVIVVFDYTTQQPTPIPDALRTAIEELEGRSLSV
jgi:acyl-CoA thioester hydrolase